jgi:hypothetical protein
MPHEHHGSEHIQAEIDAALRTKALETLLVEKGFITTDVIDEIVRLYEQDIGPLNGAKVVAIFANAGNVGRLARMIYSFVAKPGISSLRLATPARARLQLSKQIDLGRRT